MRYTRFFILVFLLLFNNQLFGQHYDFVKILPGIGVVYNNDSIYLNKTTIKELHRILKIKDSINPNEFEITMWDGFDPETLERTAGTKYTREIKFKSITFKYEDDTDKDNLKLKWISVGEYKSLKSYTDTGLIIGMINPIINDFYPFTGKDRISEDGLTYDMLKSGISLQFERLKNGDLELILIVTYLKHE